MKRILLILISIVFVFGALVACSPKAAAPEGPGTEVEKPADDKPSEELVEIDFWQHEAGARITAMEKVIAAFEEKNPNIKVNQSVFPYEEYQTKIASAVPAGTGPDVLKIYFGWAPFWSKSGFIAPLPPSVQEILETEFVPFVNATKIKGEHYAIPISVRNFALFYNIDLLSEAGWDRPPNTWDEFVQAAKDCTKYDDAGYITQAGYFMEWGADGWNWWRPLIQAYGGQVFSDDNKIALWNSEAAIKATQFMVDLTLVHKVSSEGFFEGELDAFAAGLNCMTPQLTYAVGFVKNDAAPGLNWAVTVMPEGPAGRFSTGSSWPIAISTKASKDPVKLEAATKFLEFCASEEGVRIYSDAMQELPSRIDMVNDPYYAEDPIFAPFIEQLNQTDGTFWCDELAERQCALDMYDSILLLGVDVETAANEANACDQAIRDEFFADW